MCVFTNNVTNIIIIIVVTVRRCYENLRQIFLEQQVGKEKHVDNQTKQRKYRSHRERVSISVFIDYSIILSYFSRSFSGEHQLSLKERWRSTGSI